MRLLYRVRSTMLVLVLICCLRATAQDHDTVRIGESADSSVVSTGDSTEAAADSAGSGFQTAENNPERPVLRRIPDTTVREWQADKAYAYANDPDYWRRRQDKDRDSWLLQLLSNKWTRYFLLFLLGAVLLYAIIRVIADNNLQLFYRSPKRQAAVSPQRDPSPIEDDLEGRLQHYLQARDYRQAVRYLYLKTLRLLNDRGLIKYHLDATNREYWLQLSEKAQGPAFRDLTLIYEKVWYGEFPLGGPLFHRLHQYFEDFYKTVRL